jgi:hypothetical protein
MSLTKAVSGSNAPKADGDNSKTSGSLGMVGFTPVDYPSQMPAKSNADLTSLDQAPSLGNDGTNMSAYDEQKADISGKTGK